jgi:hypothetical protein
MGLKNSIFASVAQMHFNENVGNNEPPWPGIKPVVAGNDDAAGELKVDVHPVLVPLDHSLAVPLASAGGDQESLAVGVLVDFLQVLKEMDVVGELLQLLDQSPGRHIRVPDFDFPMAFECVPNQFRLTDAYKRYGIEKPAKPKGNPYANLLASLPASTCDLGEEDYPDDPFELNTLCMQASAEAKEIRERLKSETATDEDRARHSIATRRWLTLMHKRDQALAREARRERAQAAQQKLLDESVATESGVVKLYGLLKETCDVMQQLSSAACSVNAATLAERQEFVPLIAKFAELTEDLSMWFG